MRIQSEIAGRRLSVHFDNNHDGLVSVKQDDISVFSRAHHLLHLTYRFEAAMDRGFAWLLPLVVHEASCNGKAKTSHRGANSKGALTNSCYHRVDIAHCRPSANRIEVVEDIRLPMATRFVDPKPTKSTSGPMADDVVADRVALAPS